MKKIIIAAAALLLGIVSASADNDRPIHVIREGASEGVKELRKMLVP